MSTESSTDQSPMQAQSGRGSSSSSERYLESSLGKESWKKEIVAFDPTHHPEVGRQFKAALSPEAGSRAEF